MNIEVRYHKLAENELHDAAKYYESRCSGLGRAFLTEITQAINQISAFPESAPMILDIVRQKVIHRFPYSIMYVNDDDGVMILAIANHHRRPFYWGNRISNFHE
uniref:Plasmid stabilization system n=1 Tax=Chlorobium chlorochromatii (strain CaD3) TaxID=340177 RepID=Q3APS2_CHLCH